MPFDGHVISQYFCDTLDQCVVSDDPTILNDWETSSVVLRRDIPEQIPGYFDTLAKTRSSEPVYSSLAHAANGWRLPIKFCGGGERDIKFVVSEDDRRRANAFGFGDSEDEFSPYELFGQAARINTPPCHAFAEDLVQLITRANNLFTNRNGLLLILHSFSRSADDVGFHRDGMHGVRAVWTGRTDIAPRVAFKNAHKMTASRDYPCNDPEKVEKLRSGDIAILKLALPRRDAVSEQARQPAGWGMVLAY